MRKPVFETLERRVLLSAALSASPALSKPNIVLIQTDDQRFDTFTPQVMPQAIAALTNGGTQFTSAYTVSPLSAPSRSSLLTGRYAHDDGVLSNGLPLGGSTSLDDTATVATLLQSDGYQTGLYGKYVNENDSSRNGGATPVPPGWDEFHEAHGFYNFTEYNNGVAEQFSGPDNYYTDVMASQAESFITTSASGSRPFFLYFTPSDPHSPAMPALEDQGLFTGVTKPQPPSYDFVAPNQPSWLQTLPPITDSHGQEFDVFWRQTLQSLQSVDRAVAGIVSALAASGQLDNTIIIYTSDSGLALGEHRLVGKQSPYEEATHIPLVIWDGRSQVSQTTPALAANIDIEPTIAELAGTAPLPGTDGVSLVPILTQQSTSVRSNVLIENFAPGLYIYTVHTSQFDYTEYPMTGETELYDLSVDPYEINNAAGDPFYAAVQSQLAGDLHALESPDTAGPQTTGVTVTVGGSIGSYHPLNLKATENDVSTGGGIVKGPEYFIDATDVSGNGLVMLPIDGLFNSTTEGVSATFTATQMEALTPGPHTVFVHGRDAAGNWGSFVSANFNVPAAPAMTAASDTGSSNADGITADTTPTFTGTAAANASIKLFGGTKFLGNAKADVNGKWTFTVAANQALAPGYYSIAAQASSGGVSAILSAGLPIIIVGLDSNGNLIVTGTPGDDTITANATGTSATATINGGSVGPFSVAGHLILHGGDGFDSLTASGTNAEIYGDDEDDTLIATDGNDTLDGGLGNDSMAGGSGNTTYLFESPSPANNEVDTIDEQPAGGTDTLDFTGMYDPITVDLTSDSALVLEVTREVQTAAAGEAANFENVSGGVLGDSIAGNASANFLSADGGNDTIRSGQSNDTINAGQGDDSITGGEGDDSLTGGLGNDIFVFANATSPQTDTVQELSGGGFDTLDFTAVTSAATVNLASDAALAIQSNRTVKTAASGQAADFEAALGGSANDTLLGNAAGNLLAGNGGNDSIKSLGGNDTLDGGSGTDNLAGGTGNDDYRFADPVGVENDRVAELPKNGIDTLDFSTSTIAAKADLSNATLLAIQGTRRIRPGAGQSGNFENVIGGAGDDSITGNTAANVLVGGAGNDTISGGNGNDTLDGGGGDDSLSGDAGVDQLNFSGTSDDDLLMLTLSSPGIISATQQRAGGGAILETDTLAFDSSDTVLVQALDGDDTINVANTIPIAGTIDGGPGFDTATAPNNWTKLNCEA